MLKINCFGYYRPPKEIGLTEIPDREVFEALKRFQSDQGLDATGELRPEDDAVRVMNEEIKKTKEQKYIWRTVGDDKVRPTHEALNGETRSFSDSPAPGEERNCRCSAEVIEEKSKEDKCKQLDIDLQNQELELQSLDRRLSEASERLNKILDELPKLAKALTIAKAERNFQTNISFADINVIRGLLGGLVSYRTHSEAVQDIQSRHDQALRDYDHVVFEMNDLQKEQKETSEAIRKIREQQEALGCNSD